MTYLVSFADDDRAGSRHPTLGAALQRVALEHSLDPDPDIGWCIGEVERDGLIVTIAHGDREHRRRRAREILLEIEQRLDPR